MMSRYSSLQPIASLMRLHTRSSSALPSLHRLPSPISALAHRRPTPRGDVCFRKAQGTVYTAPFGASAPGIALVKLVIGMNLLADGLRDAGDPTRRGRQ